MRPGSSMRWDALIAHATGEPLSVDHLADWLGEPVIVTPGRKERDACCS